LFELYVATNQLDKARYIARKILCKEIKIESVTITHIKERVKDWLSKNENKL